MRVIIPQFSLNCIELILIFRYLIGLMAMKWKEKVNLAKIPESPGVYIFKGQRGEALYVGKAKNLKERFRYYFGKPEDPRIRRCVERAVDVEFIVTNDEIEALILEANLIKQYQPRYNIRLKDSKAYPYIMVTMSEPFPRVAVVRRPKFESGNLYFGPYPNVSSLRKTLRMIRRLFPIRSCKYRLPSVRKIKPCLEYYIGKCIGPCTGDVSPEEYKNLVKGVLSFLQGRTDELERQLEAEMLEAAKKLEFERAAALRDQLFAIKQTKSATRRALTGAARDFVAVACAEKYAYGIVLFYRDDKIVDKAGFMLDVPRGWSESDVLNAFIEQFYSTYPVTAEEIVSSPLPSDADSLTEMVMKRTGKSIRFREPSPYEENIYAIAINNASRLLAEEIERLGIEEEVVDPALIDLMNELGLKSPPMRIEAVDISHLFGEAVVGSVVVFVNGKPRKSEYRRYRIKSVEGIDDFRAIREVVYRRLKRLMDEDKPLPDLMLIDGGKTQLEFAMDAADELGVEDVHFAALAKRFEELHLPDDRIVALPYRSKALRLLQRIRDEAHRFAIKYHRNIRDKSKFTSILDFIPGLGRSKRNALLKYFGSIEAIINADVNDLQKVPGIGPKLAQKIYEHLHGEV